LPIQWQNQQIFPVARAIGSTGRIDICSVMEGGSLQLHPLLKPNNLEVQFTKATKLVITIQARGSEADSAPLRLSLAWDGDWNEGTQEMRRHFIIKPAELVLERGAAT
jgi:hypothetical protein